MPRYSDSRWEEERWMDRYYEYLEEACECYYEYEDGAAASEPEEPCHHCERRAGEAAARAEVRRWHEEKRQQYEEAEKERKEAALAANPWREQIVTIKAQLDAVEKASGLGEKLPAVRILLTNLLSQQAFIAAQPKFRAALAKKVVELRADPKAEPLTELFDHVDSMLEGLRGREDYRA
jgi:hypothetical protein